MSNYTKLTDFATKDALPSGNAAKIVKGTEIDDELNAIETSIATKSNIASPTFTGTPTAPTATLGTNTTQLATTRFANDAAAAAVNDITKNAVLNSVTLGLFKIEDTGTSLFIAYNGTNIFKLDSDGTLTVIGPVNASTAI